MLVYAHFDGYVLTAAQRTLTKWALLSIWAMSFVDNNIAGAFRTFGGFSYSSLDLPDIAAPISEIIVGVGFVLVLYKVFYVHYRTTGQRPGPNLVVPFVAMYVWWLPQTRQDEFYFLMIPLFHSLQYLAFAYKMEDSRLRGLQHREARATLTIAGRARRLARLRVRARRLDSRLGTQDAWAVLLHDRGDVVHQHPPLLHRQRRLAIQGPAGPRVLLDRRRRP
jgi:hypothetical protein